jgi:amphi-Trp domain-containing protein
MGQERKLFKSEEPKQRSEVSEFLRQIAAKIEAGQVILRQGQEEIVLDIPANLVLEIQVEEEDKKSKGIQHSLEIEIKWFEGDEDGGAGGSLELG